MNREANWNDEKGTACCWCCSPLQGTASATVLIRRPDYVFSFTSFLLYLAKLFTHWCKAYERNADDSQLLTEEFDAYRSRCSMTPLLHGSPLHMSRSYLDSVQWSNFRERLYCIGFGGNQTMKWTAARSADRAVIGMLAVFESESWAVSDLS